jgi:hypothetical protein
LSLTPRTAAFRPEPGDWTYRRIGCPSGVTTRTAGQFTALPQREMNTMIYIRTDRPNPPPDLSAVRAALREALRSAPEPERPGLVRALAVLDTFDSQDVPTDVKWARRVLSVAGLDPQESEVKAVAALRAARPGLGLREATTLVRDL